MFGVFSLILTAVSALYNGYTNYQNNKAQAKAYEYEAKVQESNAREARRQGAYAEDLQRQKARQQQSKLRVTGAETGILSGTFYDVAGQSLLGAEMDALATRYNYEMQAVDYMNQSNISKMNARNARQSASNALIGSFLGAGASTLNRAYNYYGGGGSYSGGSGKGEEGDGKKGGGK